MGGYEENLGICEDWGLYAKLVLNYDIYVAGSSSYYYREHRGQTCNAFRNKAEFFAGHQPFFSWFLRFLDQYESIQPQVRRALRYAILHNRINILREIATHNMQRFISGLTGQTE